MNAKEFGLYFSRLREESGFKSQRELADKSGVSHSTINRIESGSHKVTPETLKALAPYLKGVTYQELMEKAGYIGDMHRTAEPYLDDDQTLFILREIAQKYNIDLTDPEKRQKLEDVIKLVADYRKDNSAH